MRTAMCSWTLGLGLCAACTCTATGQGLLVHAMTGQPVPGGSPGEVFATFDGMYEGRTLPRIDNGHIAFRTRTIAGESVRTRIIGGRSGAPIVAWGFSDGVGIPGITPVFSYESLVRVGGDGRVAFFARFAGEGVTSLNNEALLTVQDHSVQMVMRKGDQVPGMTPGSVLRPYWPSESWMDSDYYGPIRRWSYSGSGITSLTTYVSNSNQPGSYGFLATLTADTDGLSLLARAYGTDPNPRTVIDGGLIHNPISVTSINDLGTVVFGVGLDIGGGAIAAREAGELRLILRTGEPAPGMPSTVMAPSGIYAYSGSPTWPVGLNNHDDAALSVSLRVGGSTTGSGVVRIGDEGTLFVAKTGDPKPGSSGQFFTVSDLAGSRVLLSGSGEVAFADQSRRGVCVGNDISDLRLAFDPLSSVWPTNLGQPLVITDTIGMNASNQLVAALTFPTSPATTAVAGWDPIAGNILIAYTGQTIEVLPGVFRTIRAIDLNGMDGVVSGGGEDGHPNSLDDQGRIVFTAHFTNYESAVLVATIPAPSVGGVLALGVLAAARRVRRQPS
ncbi:hypothetical protein PHYC_00776 [Phycisphaerales bacterium]|nr:hypothetical protein PHYC_00776 [Phycisphaerales bacterium]